MNTAPKRFGPPRNTRFEQAIDRDLRAYAKKHDRTISNVVRLAVKIYIAGSAYCG